MYPMVYLVYHSAGLCKTFFCAYLRQLCEGDCIPWDVILASSTAFPCGTWCVCETALKWAVFHWDTWEFYFDLSYAKIVYVCSQIWLLPLCVVCFSPMWFCTLFPISCIYQLTLFQVFSFYTHFLSREGDMKLLGLCFDDLVMTMIWIWHLSIYSPCMYLWFSNWFPWQFFLSMI